METTRTVWKNFIIKLSEHLRKHEVKKLKFYFDLPAGASEQENGLETLQRLEQSEEIRRDDISRLFEAMDQIGRVDLKKELTIYQEKYREAALLEGSERDGKRPRSSYDEFEYQQNQGIQAASSVDGRNVTLPPFFSDQSKKEPFQSQEGDYFDSADDKDVYKMQSEPRGLCVIINNMFDKKKDTQASDGKLLSYRTASDKDKASLEKLFSWLKFTVKSYDNVSKKYMETVLELHAKDDKNSFYDCFVCCVLSHGYEKGIYCNDGNTMDFSEIRGFFTSEPENCELLLGKPKLFIIQACQGQNKAKGVLVKDSPVMPSEAPHDHPIQDESGAELEEQIDIDFNDDALHAQPRQIASDADISFFVATTPGTSAWRDTQIGSWFIQELTAKFKEYGETKSWSEIRYRINRSISERTQKIRRDEFAKMMSDGGLDTLTRELYFNPGRPFSSS